MSDNPFTMLIFNNQTTEAPKADPDVLAFAARIVSERGSVFSIDDERLVFADLLLERGLIERGDEQIKFFVRRVVNTAYALLEGGLHVSLHVRDPIRDEEAGWSLSEVSWKGYRRHHAPRGSDWWKVDPLTGVTSNAREIRFPVCDQIDESHSVVTHAGVSDNGTLLFAVTLTRLVALSTGTTIAFAPGALKFGFA